MIGSEQFVDLLRRLRSGDQKAAAEFVGHFQPIILREIRLRLEDRQVRTAFDSDDVSQSVLASFFVRAGVGQYDLDDAQSLVNLLLSITRHKVASLVRHEHRQKRDVRRMVDLQPEAFDRLAAKDSTPSVKVATIELLDRANTLLSDEERSIAGLRRADRTWEEVAREMGGTAQARRVQFGRAMQRIVEELGLEEGDG